MGSVEISEISGYMQQISFIGRLGQIVMNV